MTGGVVVGRFVSAGVVLSVVVGLVGFGVLPVAVADDVGVPGWFISDFGFDRLHERGVRGEGVTVAVVDTGFDLSAPDLRGADIEFVPLPGECVFSEEHLVSDHGTEILATLVGQGGGGIVGVAPGVKVLAVQTIPVDVRPDDPEWPEGCEIGEANVAGRVMAAVDMGADVVSLSVLGGGEPGPEEMAYLMARGVGYFVGAGNSKVVTSVSSVWAGSAAVGAVDRLGVVPEWSGKGPDLGLVAPGVDIPARRSSGELFLRWGTSYAAPVAAGAFALVLQAHPDASANQVMQSLVRNSRGGNADASFVSDEVGYGVIDPVAAVDADVLSYPDEPPFWEKTENKRVEVPYDQLLELYPTDLPYFEFMPGYVPGHGLDPGLIRWLPDFARDKLPAHQARWQEYQAQLGQGSASASASAFESASEQVSIAGWVWFVVAGVFVVVLGAVVGVVVWRRSSV